MQYPHRVFFLLSFVVVTGTGIAQPKADNSEDTVIAAGPEYKRSRFYQLLWGHNRRREWTTSLRVPMLWLDTAKGGLHPYKIGGGNETKSLRLQTDAGKQYSLRSVDKSRDDGIMPLFRNTFVGDVIRDGVSMSYPYGGMAICLMEDHAGIFHAVPEVVYLPQQPALDTFNERFGDDLYFLEQRPDGDWSDADNLGDFPAFYDTEDVVAKLKEDNSFAADQETFIRARLFDMLISDWDRHEGNWKWGLLKEDESGIYEPVPIDRDQAFYTRDGLCTRIMLPLAGLGFMQNFGYDTRNITPLNREAEDFDRFFSSEMTLEHWKNAAILLQQQLADSVIEQSVRQLPPEIFAVSGEELIAKLKSRRTHLVKYALQYYSFLARKVDVAGSKKNEYFEITSRSSSGTSVKIFRINTTGQREDTPYYARIFKPHETKSITVYGIDGNDVYSVTGDSGKIKITLIGGPGRDTFTQSPGSGRIHIFDDDNNDININAARLHVTATDDIPPFAYDGEH